MQDYRSTLKADILPKASAWAADFQRTVPSITKAYSEVLLKYCLSVQYTMPTNNLCYETCRIMFIKMTAKSKCSLVQKQRNWSKYLYCFSSSALNFHGPNQPSRYGIPIELLFQNLLFVERFAYQKSYDPLKSVEIFLVN